jgi:hypothetical protein
MPPEMKQVLLDNFQFVATFGTLVTWIAFKSSSAPIFKLVRRIALFGFFFFLYQYFKVYTPKIIAWLDVVDFDVRFRRYFAMTKGTDWVEGFFWGIAVCIFCGIIAALCALDFKKK